VHVATLLAVVDVGVGVMLDPTSLVWFEGTGTEASETDVVVLGIVYAVILAREETEIGSTIDSTLTVFVGVDVWLVAAGVER